MLRSELLNVFSNKKLVSFVQDNSTKLNNIVNIGPILGKLSYPSAELVDHEGRFQWYKSPSQLMPSSVVDHVVFELLDFANDRSSTKESLKLMIDRFFERNAITCWAIGFNCKNDYHEKLPMSESFLDEYDLEFMNLLKSALDKSNYIIRLIPIVITQENYGKSGMNEVVKFYSLATDHDIVKFNIRDIMFFHIDPLTVNAGNQNEGYLIDRFDIHDQMKYSKKRKSKNYNYWNIFFNHAIIVYPKTTRHDN